MPYSFDEIKRKLIRLGFQQVRQKGSHVIFSDGYTTFPVPKHGSKDISQGVEKQIMNSIGISKEEFKKIK